MKRNDIDFADLNSIWDYYESEEYREWYSRQPKKKPLGARAWLVDKFFLVLTIVIALIFLSIAGQACVPTFGSPW